MRYVTAVIMVATVLETKAFFEITFSYVLTRVMLRCAVLAEGDVLEF